MLDAVVVGAGPNGLAAAITCAAAGRSVLLLEGGEAVGGGTRTAELTLPGFAHDVCSAIHPMAAVSPFFADAQLDRHGLELVHPEIALAHPLDGGRAGVMHRSLEDTVAGLGVDGRAWDRHVGWAARHWRQIAPGVLGPLTRVPRHPIAMAGFGARGALPATVAGRALSTDEGRALLAGASAHSFLPLQRPLTTALGMMLLASGHVAGWPAVRGGSQVLADAMAARLVELGGTIETHRPVRSLADVPDARAVLFDVSPRQLLSICGHELPSAYRRRMARFRYGPGVWKVDYALSEPVPWENEACRRAGTVHVGGTMAQIAAAEAEVSSGRPAAHPFMLVAQQSLFDPTRAPAGQHTLWTYAHVPHGYEGDATPSMEAQIERFAPGFRDTVLARHVAGPAWYEAYNPNFIGGDIAGGSHGGLQLALRPRAGVRPYRTPNPKLFLCSASTPPGGGVHGMCGHHAAVAALATTLR
ncbi:MAG: NAD(P)/FAD-dependent oxidoreductase [Acidimicrobiales bacterium]|nr:NAD(P)/FAD-dependent oxidoreductase [Acidimicrobiales bacterium]